MANPTRAVGVDAAEVASAVDIKGVGSVANAPQPKVGVGTCYPITLIIK